MFDMYLYLQQILQHMTNAKTTFKSQAPLGDKCLRAFYVFWSR